MASDLFVFDNSVYRHSSSDMASSDQFYSDCFPPLPDSPIDILQAISDDSNQRNPLENCQALDQTVLGLLSSSPPINNQMQSLSLAQLQPLADAASNSANGFADFSAFDVKMDENRQVGFDSAVNNINPSFLPHSFAASSENAAKMMQRSFSSNSAFFLQPRFDTLIESPNFQAQVMSSPETSLPCGHMRRVCSTGDLQKAKIIQPSHGFSSSSLAAEGSQMEETIRSNFKVGRYSAEERKERIHRYRAKRNHRNFNKTIKYACRKTLADNRPRIRGRFARNDETADTPKAACLNHYEDEEELWIEGLHDEDDNGTVRRGQAQFFINSFGPTQFQYFRSC
ncbi:uncharacterized protein LOC131164399 [Malania oleifera]|uniref:uncharacterized protein LOC131164399 n=1 Tax=Malania oleifera TaxID=397392 RepID=UPI0025ADA757|nr:uncharacterized protein LOC131164399 [Malania oleifera]